MSRSDYHDDLDNWALIRWRGAVASAIRGKRGQALLRELADALDAMPVKELVPNAFVCDDGMCALGVLGASKGLPVDQLEDDYCGENTACMFEVSEALVREIMFMNDEGAYYGHDNDSARRKRWEVMRAWVGAQIKESRP